MSKLFSSLCEHLRPVCETSVCASEEMAKVPLGFPGLLCLADPVSCSQVEAPLFSCMELSMASCWTALQARTATQDVGSISASGD